MSTKHAEINSEIMNVPLKRLLMQAFRGCLCLLFAIYATLIFDVPVASAQYIPDTCIQGYVWRGATPDDHVCVTPMQWEQAQDENYQAASRIQPDGGAYGPKTCQQGYVWQAATRNDLVCIT